MTAREIETAIRSGNLDALGDADRRFWSKVAVAPNGCWNWTGARSKAGYGQIRRGKLFLAHRVSYECLVGPIAAGLTVDHLCRNRGCVNPDHLEAVTKRVNTLRGASPSAGHAKAKACQRGHLKTPFTINPKTQECRICCAARQRIYAITRKARKCA